MAEERSMARFEVARRLQELALRVAAGRPIRVGGRAVRVPDEVILEEELEEEDGEVEIEIELRWATKPARKAAPERAGAAARPRGRGTKR